MLVLPMGVDLVDVNVFPVLYWNHVGLQMNRITHSLGGPQGGPTMSSRALGLLHLAMHDAYFGALGHTEAGPGVPTYLPDAIRPALPASLPAPAPHTLDQANAALTGAAVAVLDTLYGDGGKGISTLARNTLTTELAAMIDHYDPPIDALGDAHMYGVDVAKAIMSRLAVKPGDIGADAGHYEPKAGPYKFRDEPLNPVRRIPIDPDNPALGSKAQRVYHGPYYGKTVLAFAVTDPDGHRVADWPNGAEYEAAFEEVVRLGGAPNLRRTERTPQETTIGLYWAYDGANLIGTPPRLYNQILRVLAWGMKDTADPTNLDQNSEFVRLFALANVAMADAGKFCWLEKYKYELWRPLSGVREHHTTHSSPTSLADADPFWAALGAPDTNSNRIAFKPPFPAYPSGHATFGAACFQMARHYYKAKRGDVFDDNGPDPYGFAFVSEELDGVSRELSDVHDPTIRIEDQPGNVRTHLLRSFPSLWHAIFENGFSRIYLGVHWRFDAADAGDIKEANGKDNKDPAQISYSHVWTQPRMQGDTLPTGGLPLGLGIANDIWANAMRAPASVATLPATAFEAKKSRTTYV